MILLCGVPSEPPLALAIEAAQALDLEHRVVNQRGELTVTLDIDQVPQARLCGAGPELDLGDVDGIYLRLAEPDDTARVRAASYDRHVAERAVVASTLLSEWCEVTGARVANPSSAMASNASKPYQLQLIAGAGFRVPPTLVTNDADAVLAFRAEHGRLVFKSTSGIRSVVRELTPDRLARLDRLAALPTSFQSYLTGTDVRVHVVGDTALACAITTPAIDYRYATGADEPLEMVPYRLPDDVQRRCLALSRLLELPFCGIDLLCDDDGAWWCFEVNPSPGYSWFEQQADLPISRALVTWLATGRAREG